MISSACMFLLLLALILMIDMHQYFSRNMIIDKSLWTGVDRGGSTVPLLKLLGASKAQSVATAM